MIDHIPYDINGAFSALHGKRHASWGVYPFRVPSASCRHNETMRDANNTPNQSVAADVSRLKLDPRPVRNGRLRNRSDPAHAGCYKREWKSTRATGQGAIAGSTIGVAFKPMLNRYEARLSGRQDACRYFGCGSAALRCIAGCQPAGRSKFPRSSPAGGTPALFLN